MNRDSVDERNSFPLYGPPKGAYEEYWYDALGRRILKRTRRESPICTVWAGCQNSTDRFIWDGDQVLWEARYSTPTPTSSRTTIGYIHAGGIDAPVGMARNSEAIVLHKNWRGLFAFSTDDQGDPTTCAPSGGTGV